METIDVRREGPIVTIELNRPERKNAINATMWDELLATFHEIGASSSDRCVVITGANNEFCSGADLAARGEGPSQHQLASMRHVGNVAVGAGCNLALGCDLVVASTNARFSEIFARRGLSVDFGGSWVLPRRIGLHRAKELAFFADIIDAAEAERIGLVNRVVADDELDTFVDGWAQRLAAAAPIAVAMTKRMLNNSMQVTMEEALDDEGLSQSVNFSTADTMEAMKAFIEKRDPAFEGR
jgi:2-(1,2-epoxy-1,2-dihydrophenyl)acetyl-CoA isomerase